MQVGQWLGFIMDTIKMQFRVPIKKITKLRAIWMPLFQHALLHVGILRRWLASSTLAVGPIARLFTRQIHSTIKDRSRWDCSFSISVPLLRICVSGSLISKPLTDTGFSLFFPRCSYFL